MLYVLLIFLGILLVGSIFFLLFQKKYVAEKAQLEVEKKLAQVRREVQHLAMRIEVGRQSFERLESRIAERNQEIRLLKEDIALQERQVRLANASGW